MNKLYVKLYQKKIFTLRDACRIIKNYQVCKNTLRRLISKNLIKRIRNTIYYILPLDNPGFYPDKLEIGSLIRNDGIICCNTALYAYKLINPEDTIYIYSKYASTITIKETKYKIMQNRHNLGIDEIDYATGYSQIKLKLTDIERTIIDCLKSRTLKTHDLIMILRTGKVELNIKKIAKYLDKYEMPILYNKTGLVLELSKDALKLKDEDLTALSKKLTKKIFYLKERGLRLIKPKYKYYSKWNIMIPENIYELANPKPILI